MQRFTERAPLARSASTITVTLDDATYDAGYHYVGVTVDDSLVGNVTAAEKTFGWWAASENTPHTVNIRPVPPCCPTSIVAALLAIAGVASLALRKKSR